MLIETEQISGSFQIIYCRGLSEGCGRDLGEESDEAAEYDAAFTLRWFPIAGHGQCRGACHVDRPCHSKAAHYSAPSPVNAALIMGRSGEAASGLALAALDHREGGVDGLSGCC